ncbi:MAG: PhoH family protein [Firmicutes bacterium]|nr:PhoH family protein [Bacillota bacterium]
MDINMKLIKEATGVDVVQRGDELVLIAESDLPDRDLTGMDMSEMKEADQEEAIGLAERIIAEYINLLKTGETIDRQKASYIVNLSREGVSYQENSVGKDVICFTHSGKPLKPKTLGQKNYVNAIREKEVVFGIGPAGTGKTYIAVAMAVNALKAKQVNKIILARPAVEAGERLGFLPGDLQDKVDPYLRPLYDALYDVLGRDAALRLKEKEVIEVVPLAYMRGRTLDNAFIILDEAQNATREQMKMFLTRMGFGSRVVVTGDVTQIDLPRGKKSGLVEAERVLKPVKDIGFCYLKGTDVVRHELVRKIVNAYDVFYKKYPEEIGE